MQRQRRDFIQISTALTLAFTAGILKPNEVFGKEWEGKLLDAKTVREAVTSLGGDLVVTSSGVTLSGPELVSSGYVVPISVSCNIAGTDLMALMIQKNPIPMSAVFRIPPDTEPRVSTRIKMGETSTIYGIVRANGNFYVGSTTINVRAGGGGCG